MKRHIDFARVPWVCLAITGISWVFAGSARAQSETSVAAQALFDEAKRLVQKNDYASACPKFEESERLEPGVGTKLNLADCYEHAGRSASAWVLYLEVEDDTKHNGQVERRKMAHDHAAALLPKLSRLTIEVSQANRVPGLTVTRDGIAVGSAQWGLAVPVDPGEHVIETNAAGKKPSRTTITVAGDASTQSFSVPALEDAPASANAGSAPITSPPGVGPNPDKPSSHPRKTAGFVTLGVGGASLLVGAIFGMRAIGKNNDSKNASDCDGNVCVRGGSGAELRDEARTAGNISTVAFALGGAAVATGLVLVLTDSKKEGPMAASLSAGAFAAPDGARFSVRGAW